MVAMTVSNRGIASFFFQTLYWSISKHWEKDLDTNWKQKYTSSILYKIGLVSS